MHALFEITGIVVRGQNRGKGLGFPTTNINLNQQIPEGVYASIVIIDHKEYQAASFVGRAETFGENRYQLESYILNFSKDIYGQKIMVKLFQKLRESKKFTSVRKLIAAIKVDVQQTKQFFARV